MNARAPHPSLLLWLVGLALSLSPGTAPARDTGQGAGRPDFSGVWLFNEERSDELGPLIDAAVGPEATRGDARREGPRVWIRRWLSGVIEDPEARYLAIEQTPREFKTGLGNDLSIFYFGREASSRGPNGEPSRVSVSWKGPQLITEERWSDGGRAMSVYTLLPGETTLIVAYRLEHKTLLKPLEVRMFFDREEDEDD